MDLRTFLESVRENGKNGGLFVVAILGFFAAVIFWQVTVVLAVGFLAIVILNFLISCVRDRLSRREPPAMPRGPFITFKVRNFK
ncbi:MAG TPA: hypothetical protein VK968_05445 [Roseimicrobium sp.]|nr:hypothetical protein [Roseimicrobium sp.]